MDSLQYSSLEIPASPPPAEFGRGSSAVRACLSRRGMQNWIRGYLAACNAGDAARIASYFESDAVRYFPIGTYDGALRGAAEIGRSFAAAVRESGCAWALDKMLCEAESRRAVIEWTMVSQGRCKVLRGSEWFRFSQCGLIQESRAYFAAAPDRQLAAAELADFDYAGRGYGQGLPPP
jgi:hypothetical protein